MNYSHSLEKLLEQIKSSVLPAPELMQVDEDCVCRAPPRRDLFEQLIDSDGDQAACQNHLSSRRSLGRPDSPRFYSTDMDIQDEQHTGCKCTKIDCLKLYCECFAKGRLCGKKCICSCCGNHSHNSAGIYHAQRVANHRNPGHFPGVPAYVPGRKCTCKKSSCHKNYCQCFRAGVPCGEECQCLDCRNGKPHHHDQRMRPFGMELEMSQMEVSTLA